MAAGGGRPDMAQAGGKAAREVARGPGSGSSEIEKLLDG